MSEPKSNSTAIAGSSPVPCSPSLEYRRVGIYLNIQGSFEDANAIRDAIGERIDDEILMPIILEVMEERGMSGRVDFEVKGERWIPENV